MISYKYEFKSKGIYKIDHRDRVMSNVRDLNIADFYIDRNVQDVVLLNIFQIGELSKTFSDQFINEYNKVPWKQIKGMSDIIVQGYQTVNLERTYNTATNDIADLFLYCKQIYKHSEDI